MTLTLHQTAAADPATAGTAATSPPPPATTARRPSLAGGAHKWDQPFAEAKQSVIAAFEREYVESIMTRSKGNLAEGARMAGMDRANFRRLARRHDVDLDKFRDD